MKFAAQNHQLGLQGFGARYYDPSLGRWTQQDPLIGSLADPKMLNRYAYAGCDPVNVTDVSGLGTVSCAVAILATLVTFAATVIFFPASSVLIAVAGWQLILSAVGIITSCYGYY